MRQAAMTLPASAAMRAMPTIAQPHWDREDGRTLWATSSAIVAAVHVGVLALALLWHPRPDHAAPPPAAMMIDLTPMPAPAAARPVERMEEAPKPEPVVKEAAVRLPAPKPKPVVRKVEQAPPTEKTEDRPPAPVETEAPIAAKMAAPAPGASPTPPSNAVPTWQGTLRAHLERYKRYPAIAQARRQEGVTHVRFAMKSDGAVLWARLERPSGFSRLDDEAVALVERAQPLPLPPPELQGGPIEIVVPIQFFMR